MSNDKKINPYVKLGLDLGPMLLFFIAYSQMKDQTYSFGGNEYSGFIVVTLLFVPMLAVTTLILYQLTGKVSRMQVMTLVIVVVFGGLTVWLNDERFFKMRPTLVFLLFASILGFGLWRGKSYLQVVMEEVMPLKHEGWMILTKRLVVLFVILGVSNEFVWRTMSTDVWVKFEVFGQPAAMFIFFMMQSQLFEKYAIKEEA